MNKKNKFVASLVLIMMSAFICQSLHAMSSTNFFINWDSINIGGNDFSSSTNYYLHDTLGEIATGRSSSTNWWIYAGYRQPDEVTRYLQFEISAQYNPSKIAYSTFDDTNKQVTVTSVDGYSVGDYITVIEDMGASQLVAIGKITNIAGNVLTVDKWDGDNAVMLAGPMVGGNDWVYRLAGNSVDLGLLRTTTVNTAVSRVETHTNARNGYTVSITENHDLSYGPYAINDIVDGAVSAGSEEYGIETVGDNASGTGDFLINSIGQSIQVSGSEADHERLGIIFKAAIDGNTEGGGLSHTVSFYVTPHF